MFLVKGTVLATSACSTTLCCKREWRCIGTAEPAVFELIRISDYVDLVAEMHLGFIAKCKNKKAKKGNEIVLKELRSSPTSI